MLKTITFIAHLKAGGAEWEERIYTIVPSDATDEEIKATCEAEAKEWALKQVSLKIEIED